MLKFDSINLYKEIEKTDQIPDEAERTVRFQLIDSIIDKINEYNGHLLDCEYSKKRQEIIDRGVVFVPQPKSSMIRANWSRLFAASVSAEDKKAIHYESFKWHIFSFKRVEALSGLKARRAFNRCKKETVYLFYQNKDESFYIENPQLLRSSDFDSDYDVYVFDAARKWTYVHTHELQCGPYFFKL
ncbi:MAG TPA: DUF4275 family protein [Clostridiales bacterium]|nr:DUF4275 family protein [Clostridiales bacterium]